MIEEVNRSGLVRQLENGGVLYSETSPVVLVVNDVESMWKRH